jgi:hypothetical protein
MIGERTESDELPWEQPGCARLDCEPHRGPLLWVLGMASIIGGILSLVFIFPAVVVLPLGLATWLMARRDVAKMDAHVMDPEGRRQTVRARDTGLCGAALSLLAWTIIAVLFAMALLVP